MLPPRTDLGRKSSRVKDPSLALRYALPTAVAGRGIKEDLTTQASGKTLRVLRMTSGLWLQKASSENQPIRKLPPRTVWGHGGPYICLVQGRQKILRSESRSAASTNPRSLKTG